MITSSSGRLVYLRCPYQANVMNTLEPINNAIGARWFHMDELWQACEDAHSQPWGRRGASGTRNTLQLTRARAD